MCLAVAMGAGLLVISDAEPASADSFVITERVRYGRNQAVIVDMGVATFTNTCERGANDWIYSAADLYVMRTGTEPGLYGQFHDVSGKPNTVIGTTGGGFFGELIGYTAPGGSLRPGTYSVGIDECQDGQFGNEDTIVTEVFHVTSQVLGPQIPDIGALKAAASEKAAYYESSGEIWNALLQLNDAVTMMGAMTGLGGVLPIAYLVFTKFYTTTGLLPDPGSILTQHYGNLSKRWEGIAADPPDRAFDQPSPLGPTAPPGPTDDLDPLQAAAVEASGPAAISSELSLSLLRSLERYQGAHAAGDGEWMLHHARAIRDTSDLLVAHGPAESAALRDLADVVEAHGPDLDDDSTAALALVDAYLASDPTPAERADLANTANSDAGVRQVLSTWRSEISHHDPATLAAQLRGTADQVADTSAALESLSSDMGPVISTLEADPFVVGEVPEVELSGPYAATVGEQLPLTATATVGELAAPGELTFAWDLDGDGAFDDATGASTSLLPTAGGEQVVGVEVTGPLGHRGVAHALVTVGGPVPGSAVIGYTPGLRSLEVPVGTTQVFEISTSGEGTQVHWHLDGAAVDTGTGYELTPRLELAGVHRITAEVRDGTGRRGRIDWQVKVTAADLDGDGYWSTVDCDDTEPATYPGAPELLDGVDNDCDPDSVDGGVEPVVTPAAPPPTPEGTELTLTTAFTNVGGPYTATVDWGDGTTGPATVSGHTATVKHTYADDGVFPVEVCVRAASGRVGCGRTEATIANEAPRATFGDLFDWTVEEYHNGAGLWTVASDGQSVFQSINGDPTFFMSDAPLGTSEAGVTLRVETSGDDDLVGFALGLEPGFTTDPDADYLLIDWKRNDQSYGGCDGNYTALEGLAVSRVRGIPNTANLWPHTSCSSYGGGSVEELARATNLGSTGWDDNVSYDFRFRLTPTRLLIWVDDVLEFDLTGEFPSGHFGFYNYSQSNVRYSGYQLAPGSAVEGAPETMTAEFDDPGVRDTHTGMFSWGDGSPDDTASIEEADGEGTASATHTWLEDGDYEAEACVTDDDGARACQLVPVRVANAAPVVDAGRARATGADVVLVDSVFTDPGILDTHTATVDWGDGSDPDDAVVDSELGEGLIAASHTYGADGSYQVEVCVTDDDGDTGCDTVDVDVRVSNRAPVPETQEPTTVDEGSVVTRMVAFTDENPDDTHSATVDWGDGSSPEVVELFDGGSIGTGGAAHTYPEDGVYPVTFEVCDDRGDCEETGTSVTVLNVAPEVDATVSSDSGPGLRTFTVTGSFTDVGVEDSHTATVDWGDGSDPTTATVTQEAGGGTLTASHVYTTAGTFTALVCVTDDDGGETCVPVEVATGLPSAPLDVSAIGGDGNARVRWQPPASDGGSEILEYEVEATPSGTKTVVDADTLAAVVGGLANDTEHTFRVRARNAYGWGPWSEPSNVALTRPSCPGAPFLDVGPTHPFCPEIKWMGDNGVATGWPDGTYRPDVAVSRQAMAAFTYRLLNPGAPPLPRCTSRPFSDVAVSDPYCPEITWMKDSGITSGYADGTFKAPTPVSRQAMAAFLYRLTDSPRGADPQCTRDEFTDVKMAHGFCGEIDWLVDVGVVAGYESGEFRPTAPISRQAMAAFVFRYNVLTGRIG